MDFSIGHPPREGKIMPIDSRAVKPPRIPEFEGSFTDRTLPELQAIAVALRGTSYPGENDWVFASHRRRGRLPYWPDMILKRHIRPLAGRLGIRKRIGWHTFRRSFATLLKANGEDVKTTQELLRQPHYHAAAVRVGHTR